MKIVMFSINPIFPELVTGGASKHLFHIARFLGEQGHDVEVLCAGTEGNRDKFQWAENVFVCPILPFHLPFPQPYAISGGELALIVDRLAGHLQHADRFYVHDGEFLLPDLYWDIPTIISFRDNIYPESILGTFIGKADEVICVSQYSTAVIAASAGRFYPGLSDRIHQVNNGIDLSVFKPVESAQLAQLLGVNPAEEVVLFHPHRPEPGKGLPETIRVTARLVHQDHLENLKVLVPEWIGSMVSGGESHFYNEMLHLMVDLEVREKFFFIPWIPQEKMPEFYCLANATLCLGHIVEAFGNVAYESLACGTPSVVANVGVHRMLLPNKMLDKVPYGETALAAERVKAILLEHRRVPESTRNYLGTHLNFEEQVRSYAQVIASARKRTSLRFSYTAPSQNQKYVLAPWCYIEGERLYHDYQGRFTPAGLLGSLAANGRLFTKDDANQLGVSDAEWETWVNTTRIVPEFTLPMEV